MVDNESISKEDIDLMFLTDSVEEMKEHLNEHTVKRFGFIKKPMVTRWCFGETKLKRI
ncbi:hypothetical protein [Maribacter sp. ACAM166]|uniref:hypothetical protein n=1 Tax=Maribacter sp. ACAM166 TaxID=2508996 RepID=UPI002017EE7F|nr:hypothetical protein [Maribacter sp. ACAM166]